MADLRSRWRDGWLEATAYDAVVEREHLARVLGRLAWGVDIGAFFEEIARLGELPDGATVLDVPCGGGVAFRGLASDQAIRYVAADLSSVMLARARAEARRRGLRQIEFVQADVEALPFGDASFDLCITYTGLHCFPDPAAAVGELARVLRPGGIVRGSAVVAGAGVRQDLLVRILRRAGVFGPGGTAGALAQWLAAAGLVDIATRCDGALAYFSAVRPAP